MSMFLLIQISPVISISWICWLISEFKTPEIDEFVFSMSRRGQISCTSLNLAE